MKCRFVALWLLRRPLTARRAPPKFGVRMHQLQIEPPKQFILLTTCFALSTWERDSGRSPVNWRRWMQISWIQVELIQINPNKFEQIRTYSSRFKFEHLALNGEHFSEMIGCLWHLVKVGTQTVTYTVYTNSVTLCATASYLLAYLHTVLHTVLHTMYRFINSPFTGVRPKSVDLFAFSRDLCETVRALTHRLISAQAEQFLCSSNLHLNGGVRSVKTVLCKSTT